MPGPVTAYQTGVHGDRPAASSGAILFACTTHSIVYRSDGTTWVDFITIGTSSYTDPLTTKGDILGRSTVTARVPIGTNGDVLTADSVETLGLKWATPAPTAADYLVGTAQTGLSAEIVVGATPGGELGNTWASPTVDATHSGSAHTDFIAKALVDAKGDSIWATAADTVARLAVGADGTIPVATSGASTGIAWVAALPWTIDRVALFGSAAQTNWSTLVTASGGGADMVYNAVMQSSGAQDAEIAWDEVLAAGTWDFALRHYTEANRGIYSLQFDGTDKGTIDGYAVTPGSLFALGTITGITVATTAVIRVSLQMATKNASSSSYYGGISGYQLRRTA